jgi:hypothetical protein
VTQAKLREALKKCGATGGFGRGGRGGFRFNSAALAKFETCMRSNGVNLPAANTSGKGPIFNTKGIDTNSTAFKSAESKCRSDLGGAAGGGGAPPSGSGSPPSETAG